MPSMSPPRGLAEDVLAAMCSVGLIRASVLRENGTADAERSDQHGNDDQFLHHLDAPQGIVWA